MRLQIANPADHPALVVWPFATPLADWAIDGMHRVTGLHRHVVRLVEAGEQSYVVKELPDELALREWRLLRELVESELPTADVVGVVTERRDGLDGLVITRHLDYALPYRLLLSGRGLQIPYLGDRLLDALAVLLVRLHLAGFYWGDCSLSNTLFRRDAGALMAFVIDMETGEHHPTLSDGQRALDLQIATENVAGDLLDLQAGGLLASGIDPVATALAIEARYASLWSELTDVEEFGVDETFRLERRLARLHDLGFDAAELELVSTDAGSRLRMVPRVVEHGYHEERLATLTGLDTSENQARRLLNDISAFRTVLRGRGEKRLTDAVVAARWLDERFDAVIEAIPAELTGKLQPAELFHQVLEHQWYLSERAGHDIGFDVAVAGYVRDVLATATTEIRVGDSGVLPRLP